MFVYEAKYHKAYHSQYLKTKPKEQASHNETLYTATLETLMNTSEQNLKLDRAYLITDFLKKFQTLPELYISIYKTKFKTED